MSGTHDIQLLGPVNHGRNVDTTTAEPTEPRLFGGGTSRTMATGANVFGPITRSTRSASGGGSSPSEQLKPVTTFGPFGVTPPTSTDVSRPPVMTGTSTPAYQVWSEKEPSNPSITCQYQTITAMPAYNGTSLEQLRVQDYQDRRTSDTSGQTSSGTSAMPTTSPFPTPTMTKQHTVGLKFEGGTTGTPKASGKQPPTTGTITGPRAFTGNSVFGKPQQSSASASGEPKPGSTLAQPDSRQPECLEELARKFLLGEELVNTQFHLFSAKSFSSGPVMKPRALCANNALPAKSSKYFMDLLSGGINSPDPSLVYLMGYYDVPNNALIDDYGYESDSDLDECDDSIPAVNLEVPTEQPVSRDSDGLSDDSSESVSSDMFVMCLEQPGEDEPFAMGKDGDSLVASSEAAVRETLGNNGLGKQTATCLQSLGSRHVLIKDTAFQTWYTLLNYLYTDKVSFLPLSSTTPGKQRESSRSSLDMPSCSAKSMYRLASKVGFDHLRDEACSHIRNNLTEHNILKELSCSIVSKYPQLLEMELDVLCSWRIASPPVVANFPALAQRLVHGELPHGADIIVGIYTRFLNECHPRALKPAPPVPTLVPTSSGLPELVIPDASASGASRAEAKRKTGSSHLDQQGTQLVSSPSGSVGSRFTPSVPPQAPDAGGKKKGAGKRKCKM